MRFFTFSIFALFVTGNFCSRSGCLDNHKSSNVSKLSPNAVCNHELSPLSPSSLPSIPEEVSVSDLIMIYKELICAQQKESELKDKIIADLRQQLAEICIQLEKVKLENQHVLSFMESNLYHVGLNAFSDSGSENDGVVDGDEDVVAVTDCAVCVVEDVEKPLESTLKAEKQHSHNRFLFESSSEEQEQEQEEEQDKDEELEKTNKKSKKKKKDKKKSAKMDDYDGDVECIIC